ncbi:MAG: BatA domain-containing protein [Acidobacteriota bacterium]|jgi:hypothetical protein
MGALLWGNPLAWLGAAAVAVPILVHLLATTRARRMPFPTLRFLPASMPAAMRAHRIEEPALLALRCLIVLLAVAALAQPWLALDGRRGEGDETRRVVVVDISESMGRATPDGTTALEAARAAAVEMVAADPPTTVIESDDLAGGLAAARLRLQEMPAGGVAATEIVLISDFQRGSLRVDGLAALPQGTGVRLRKIDVAPRAEIDTPVLLAGDRAWSSTVGDGEQRTVVRWHAAAPGPNAADTPIATTAAGPDIFSAATAEDAAAALATVAAADRWVAVPRDAPPRPVTVVWPRAPERDALQAAAEPLSEPWMADALAALPEDQPLSAGASNGRLLLFAGVEPGDAPAAALIAALRRAATDLTQLDELEPESIDAATLRGWERPAEVHAVAADSDARWLWLLVLALLLLEQGVRRGGRPRGQQTAAPAGNTGGPDVD